MFDTNHGIASTGSASSALCTVSGGGIGGKCLVGKCRTVDATAICDCPPGHPGDRCEVGLGNPG